MQAGREPADQVLQRVADGDLGTHALAVLFLQLLEVAVDRGLRAGVTQRHPQGVNRWVFSLCKQAAAGLLNIGFVQAASRHDCLPVIS